MIQQWLQTNGTFQTGVELYKRFGDGIWLDVFDSLGYTDFTYATLREELQKLADLEPKEVATSTTKTKLSDSETAHPEIKAATETRKRLYKEVNRLHERLCMYVESLPEYEGKCSGTITYKEVIKEMDAKDLHGEAIAFNIIAISANKTQGTGGEVLNFQKVIQAKNQKVKATKILNTGFEKKQTNRSQLQNRMRRLYNPETEEIRNVDMILITHFNWKRMIY